RLAATLDADPATPPTDPALLDAYEALFEHTLLAGDLDSATRLYARALGGFRHLGLRTGELARGLRLVRAFARPPHGSGGDDEALALAEQSIAVARAASDDDGLVRGLGMRGAILGALGRFDEALSSFQEARALGDVPTARRALWEAETLAATGQRGQAAALTR